MKNYGYFLPFLCFIMACSKTDVRKGMESYSSMYFTQFDQPLYGVDLLVANDESIIIAGAEVQYGIVNAKPLVLKLDQEKEISWMSFLPEDAQYTFSTMNLSATSDDNYLLLLNSKKPDSEEERGLDLSRINKSGNIIWNKRLYEDDKNLRSSSLVQLSDGDYLIFNEDEQNFNAPNELHLSRVSTSGELIWSKLIENTAVSTLGPLLDFPEQEFLIGISERYLGFQGTEVRVYKFDLEGNILWQKAIAEAGDIGTNSTHITKVQGDDLMVSFSSGANVVLMRMNTDGNVLWEKTFEGGPSDFSVGGIQTNDNQYLLLRNTASYGNGGFDLMLTKVDQNGEIIWDKVYGGAKSDHADKVVEKANGDLVVIGNSNESTGSSSQYHLFILETDSEGNPK